MRIQTSPKFARDGVSRIQIASLPNRIKAQGVLISAVDELPLPVGDVKDETILATTLGGNTGYLVTRGDDGQWLGHVIPC
ncbi:MAG: hypothetical protein QOF73_4435, partial [Thermomicrobiales bacterium]|nr:hypothetical protein [Thermomicrobiales bacterium]